MKLTSGQWKFVVLAASLTVLLVSGGLYLVMQLPPGTAREIAGPVSALVAGCTAVAIAYLVGRKNKWW